MLKFLSLIILLAYASLHTSCGIKLSPQSEIQDFRPAIPFHPEPLKPEETTKDGKNKNNEPEPKQK